MIKNHMKKDLKAIKKIKDTKRHYNYRNHVMAIFLAIVMVLSVMSNTAMAFAKTTSDIQNDITKMEEEKKKNQEAKDKLKNQKDQEQSELKDLQGQKKDIQGNVNSISGNISSVRGEITNLQNKIASNSNSLSTLAQEKADAEIKEATIKKELAARMKVAYESRGSDSIIMILISSSSFSEFLNRTEYMVQIAKHDNKLISSLEKLRASIDAKTAEINKEQTDLSANRESLSTKQTALSGLLDTAKDSLDDKSGEVQKQAEVVVAINANIEEYNNQAKQIDAQQAAAQGSLADMILGNEEANEPQQPDSGGGTSGTDPGNPSNPTNPAPDPGNTNSRTPIPFSSVEDANRHAGISPGAYGSYSYTDEEVKMLRAIVQAESGNQGLSGQRAVASVIMNRVYSKNTGYKNIQSVIFAPGQFQPVAASMRRTWADGTVGTPYEFYFSHEDKISDTTKQAVSEVLGGQQFVCALFFMTPGAFSKQEWIWKNGRRVVDYSQLGGHVFFNVLTKNQQL